MTAPHNDDQDLGSVRVPRRAAAVYAAGLDTSSQPLMVQIKSATAIIVGTLGVVAGLFLLVIAILNPEKDVFFQAIQGVVGVGFLTGGSIAVVLSLKYKANLRARNVI